MRDSRPDAELDPCEECPGCLQVEAGTHPDLIEAGKPEDKHELPISVIRELCDQFALKPARGTHKVAIVDDADDLNEEASNAFLKTLEEPPPGAVLDLDRHLGRDSARDDRLAVPGRAVRPACPSPRSPPCSWNKGSRATRPTRRGWPRSAKAASAAPSAWPTPSSSGSVADLIDELAADHGFQAPELAHRLLAYIKQAGKESVDQRRRASLLIGELARFFRGVLWQTAGLAPPCPDPADRRAADALAARLEPEDVLVLADRCIEADYHLARRLYMPLILESLMHDLGKVVNPRG